jgi:hypothetical protein
MAQTPDRFTGCQVDNQWKYPHYLGVLNRKNIVMQVPGNSDSYYYNSKSTFSIILLAIIDTEFKFMFVYVGCNGSVSWWILLTAAPYTKHWELA